MYFMKKVFSHYQTARDWNRHCQLAKRASQQDLRFISYIIYFNDLKVDYLFFINYDLQKENKENSHVFKKFQFQLHNIF